MEEVGSLDGEPSELGGEHEGWALRIRRATRWRG